jgi:hypothetical protein
MFTLSIKARSFLALLVFRAKKDRDLDGIFIEIFNDSKAVAYATDGKVLGAAPVLQEGVSSFPPGRLQIMYPQREPAVTLIKSQVLRDTEFSVKFEAQLLKDTASTLVEPKITLCVQGLQKSVFARFDPGKLALLRLPETASGEKAQFAVEYVAAIYAACKILNPKRPRAYIAHNGSAGALVTFPGMEDEFYGVIMPVIIADEDFSHTRPSWASDDPEAEDEA